jgi:acyl-CoA synthetase (AMP-forming)/AMP-acid ligase II
MEPILHILSPSISPRLSLLSGPTSPPLVHYTLGTLLDQQSSQRKSHEAIICPSLSTRWSYTELQSQSLAVAKGLLSLGVKAGDRIGILAGNCAEYVAVFFAAGYVGAVLVVLNNTYTASEARNALHHSGELFGDQKQR